MKHQSFESFEGFVFLVGFCPWDYCVLKLLVGDDSGGEQLLRAFGYGGRGKVKEE